MEKEGSEEESTASKAQGLSVQAAAWSVFAYDTLCFSVARRESKHVKEFGWSHLHSRTLQGLNCSIPQ
jgi:hypothetical protein